MRCTLATLALAAVAVANPVPQGVTSAIAPSGSAPEGCSPDFSGSFQIQVVKASAKRDLAARQAGALIITLSGGVLMDNDGRTGYIAANHQFQFDDPPQTGAIYTAGWSVCSNGSLAIGPNAIFYQCLSGTFYNLYDESTGAQCSPVYIDAIGSGGSAPAPVPSGGASVMSDGQPTAGPAVTQISDGQIQAPVCTEIVDGQPQCPTAPACTEIVDGQPQCPSGAPVTQISDGQIQAPTATPAAPVTQISDGQIQAPTSVPCTEIVDGQPQCPTAAPPAAPVTQISDGQIQAPTATPAAPVTQISDGQIQAPSGVVTQISDGQIQAPSATPCTQIVDGQPQCPSGAANYSSPATPAPSVVPATGAASTFTIGNSVFGLVAVVFAVMLL